MKLQNFDHFAKIAKTDETKEELEHWLKYFIGEGRAKSLGESMEEVFLYRITDSCSLLDWLGVESTPETIAALNKIVILDDYDCPKCGGKFELNREKTTGDYDAWTCQFCNKTFIEKNGKYEIKD